LVSANSHHTKEVFDDTCACEIEASCPRRLPFLGHIARSLEDVSIQHKPAAVVGTSTAKQSLPQMIH